MIQNNILINTETRKIKKQDYDFIGVAGENKVEQLVFKLTAFIDGIATLEYQKDDGKTDFITLPNPENEAYILDVKNELLKDTRKIYMQLHITTANVEVFKSKIFPMNVLEQIGATTEAPEEYEEWIDVANAKIQEISNLEQSISEAERNRSTNENERVTNEQNREVYINELKRARENGDLNGGTFTPSVDADGNLSWTNNKELPNPKTQNIRGPQGPVGPQGEAFQIKKTYPSMEAMQADFNSMQIGDYVMIANSVEIEDNAKLYTKTENAWVYITDFSGATGIQGPKGDQGIQGIQGEQGVGISNLEVRDGELYVTLTNNTTQKAGTILTQEVKQWIVEQITENAKSDFNTFYNGKVDSFEETVDDKIAEIEALNTLHIISEEVIDL